MGPSSVRGAVARAAATVENQSELLTADDVDAICAAPADDRDFIRSTFDGLYSFGTHATAQRREVSEYLFIGR